MKQYVEIEDEQAWLGRANTYFELYQTDPTRKMYISTANGRAFGFALVNRIYRFNTEGNVVADFYIAPEEQRGGHGCALAEYAFAQQSGLWEVSVCDENVSAYIFWNKVISGYSKDSYAIQRNQSYKGQAFTFNTV